MIGQVLHIVEKAAPVEFFPAVPQNFVVRPGGSVPAETVLGDPDISLYCLDDENRQAYFVETSAGVDLTGEPFVYLAQYEHARRLITVPYDTLHRLADGLPDPTRLILVYSVGRCGSTLISRALGAVAGVRGYSEPDVFSQIAVLRHENPGRDEEYARLVRTCTRILGQGAEALVIKFRAIGIQLADLFHQVFPDARGIFLHRRARPWLESMNRGFTSHLSGLDGEAEAIFTRYMTAQASLMLPFAVRHQRQPTPAEAYTLNWLSVMDRYLRLHEDGVPLLEVRYEEIVARPKPTLAALLAYCDLPVDEVDTLYQTFSTDSQEGTALSRAGRAQHAAPALGAEEYARARAVIAEHPIIGSRDDLVDGPAGSG
jgi:hypothetical protein